MFSRACYFPIPKIYSLQENSQTHHDNFNNVHIYTEQHVFKAECEKEFSVVSFSRVLATAILKARKGFNVIGVFYIVEQHVQMREAFIYHILY